MNATAVAAPPKLHPPIRRAIWSALVLGGALVSGGFLYAFNPADHALYPACWLYATTGLKCPGCGGLRATHELLHGHLTAAWALNPLAVLLLPLWAWLGLHAGLTLLRGRGLPHATPRPAVMWLAAAALVAFGILRNLPLR
ncbi:MAG TPA: DUF2752 domain-containing protein [Opitutaceae bacterium]|nr:DUF2752 domain-containing protein [Opitutaceae bacterium]